MQALEGKFKVKKGSGREKTHVGERGEGNENDFYVEVAMKISLVSSNLIKIFICF